MLFGAVIFSALNASAQATRYTNNKADQTLSSTGRVNPSTLGMEMEIPLGGYPGRGVSLPISLRYSSKIWRMGNPSSEPNGIVDTGCRSLYSAVYSDNSASGWTTSLADPYIEYTGKNQPFDDHGFPLDDGHPRCDQGAPAPPQYPGNAYVRRLVVHLPSGETHELRASDEGPVIYPSNSNCLSPTAPSCDANDPSLPANWNRTYYAADGSNLRYIEDSSTGTYQLQMPDGSFYEFAAAVSSINEGIARTATKYTDRNGNHADYSVPNKTWTDTLGRTLAAPLPATAPSSATTETYNLPGMTGSYQFKWKQLKGATAAESGLTDFSQSLKYTGDRVRVYNGDWTSRPAGTYLFDSNLPLGWNSYAVSSAEVFNPIVLTEIVLPTGGTYQFKYDVYGQIERIEYPTGGEERFVYSQIKPLSYTQLQSVTEKTNLGVTTRQVYPTAGQGTPYEWHYAANYVAPGGYKISTTNPDQTISERSVYQGNANCPGNCSNGDFGYETALAGMPYEELNFSSAGALVAKTLTSWTKTSFATPPGSRATADWHPRVTESQSFIYDENGNAVSSTVKDEYEGDLSQRETPVLKNKTTEYAFIPLAGGSSSSAPTPGGAPAPNPTPVPTPASASLTPLRMTETDYLSDSNYQARNMVSLPVETRVKDASGTVKAKSQIGYDEITYFPIIAAGTNAQWTDPNTNYRGNATTMRSWTDVANNLYTETHAQYDNFGNLRNAWDANGNLSSVDYSSIDAYAYPTSTTSAVPDPTGQHGSSTSLTTSTIYDFNTGLPTSVTDANNQTSTMEYNDPLLRPTRVIAPNGQQTITEYGTGTSALTRYVHSKTQLDVNNWKEGYSWYDGLGRTYKSQSVDPLKGDVFALTCFDAYGRALKSSNPFRNVANAGCTSSLEWTANTYDAQNRIIKVTSPDNSEVNTAYSLATSGTDLGTVVTVTDQAGKQRRSVTNGLGQLKRVDEPTDASGLGALGSPNQYTSYGYDTLNNLVTVNQGSQTRTFQYDSMSRLKQAVNPESGTIAYQYDNNGNLTSKTDARNVVTNYSYDGLNRVTNRNYVPPTTGIQNYSATPAVNYTYDDSNIAFSKGKLTKVVTGDNPASPVSTTEYQAFDQMGRVTQSNQKTDGMTISPMTYTYNLSGALIEETYPSGRTVKNTVDQNGELSQVQSKKNANTGYLNYAGAFTYTAAGAVSSMRLGNGKWESTQFNSRLQPTEIALGNVTGATNLLKLDYTYNSSSSVADNNGNVRTQTITTPSVGGNAGFTAVQSYSYDSLNRIKDATEMVTPNGQSTSSQSWKQTFQYDRYGNRTFDTSNNNTTTLIANCPTAVCNPAASTSDNRYTTAQGYSYDLVGNTIINAESRRFTYDGENKQTKVETVNPNNQNYPANLTGTLGEYVYDGDGKRVKKISADEETVFIYDAGGKMVAEYAHAVASQLEAKVSYLTADHLGSPRINTDTNGAVISRHDYQPFGEEVARTSYGGDEVRKQFTAYERDNESGLDFAQARYYNKQHGRFTSADEPFNDQFQSNPQSWNLYSYVRNNPLNMADPLGMAADCPRGWEGCIERDGQFYYKNPDTGEESLIETGVVKIDSDDSGVLSNNEFEGSFIHENGVRTLSVGEALHQQQENRKASIRNNLFALGGHLLGGLIGRLGSLFGAEASQAESAFANGVTKTMLQTAANDPGSTVRVVTNLTQAPQTGRALSVAVGEGAEGLASTARSGGRLFTANIPKALIENLKTAGLVEERVTMMGGAKGTELYFRPEAAEFITKFFH